MSHAFNPATVQPADLTVAAVASRMAPYQAQIDELVRRFPQRRAVLLQVLWLVQQEFGWVPRVAIEWAAGVAKIGAVQAFAVVEFYTMYRQWPTGRHLVQVCQTMCCHIQGSESLIAHLEKTLGVTAGDPTRATSADGLFTLVRVECLALCGTGPGVMIDDQAIGPVPHPLGGDLRETHLEQADFHPTPAVLDAWIAFLRDQAQRSTTGKAGSSVQDWPALGDLVLATPGHPGAPGATAQPLPADYFPAAPALKVAAKVDGTTVTVTWANDPSLTAQVVVERSDDGATWREVASVGPKDQKFSESLTAGATARYRVIAHEKTRPGRPSAIATATVPAPPAAGATP